VTDTPDVRDLIVDTALELAAQRPWEAVRLHDVATAAGITLEDVRLHFREKEDLVDAWFDRADSAMLRAAQDSGFAALTVRQKLHLLIMTWLAALAPHRKATREMIYGKMEPGHIHIQIPGLMRVSRTVQWMREAAHQDATYVRRALEETALTSIYLMTFFYWMCDDSPGTERTARFLDGWLARAESAAQRLSAGSAGARPDGNVARR
jgi:ubiquinone biosynthesis protein COQ9